MPLISPNLYQLKNISLFSEITGREWNLDVAFNIIEFSLYEGLFSEAVSGNLLLSDTSNLVSVIPIVGNEKIKISLEDNSKNKIDLQFRVYSISSYSVENIGTSAYILNFTSEEYFLSTNTSISRAYKNITASDIAKRIYDSLETDKSFDIEETRYLLDVIIPSWSPFKSINWLTSRASSLVYDGASFLFFETLSGYNFKSLELLMDVDEVYRTFVNIPVQSDDLKSNYQLIRQFRVKDCFNTIKHQLHGMYSSRVISHDIVKRKYDILDFNYRDTFKNYKHLNPGILIPSDTVDNSLDYTDNPQGMINVVPKHFNLFDNEGQNYNTHREKVLQIRKSQLEQINNLKIEIIITGDLEIRCGNIVEVLTPSNSTSGTWEWDLHLSGKYLITSIRHSFSPNGHDTLLTLQRDTYSQKI
tara:strand:- start:109 stop:1356 length:1248 start_codon:yes stop_codon:yes gene_type:complete